MSKEDRAAFLEWKRGMAGDTTILIRPFSGPTFAAWGSACAYKDKRIAELQKIIDLDTERFRELGEEIQELKKRIAELEKVLPQIELLLEPGSWVFGTSLGNDGKRLYILNLIKRITEGGTDDY